MAQRIFVPTSFFVLTFASLLAFAATAAAAPLSGGAGPEEEACAGRASGDACVLPNNTPGTCGPATCNRLDYSGGSPPKAIEEACIVCKQGPPMLGGDGDDGSVDAGEPAASDGGAEPSTSVVAADGSKEPPESTSRCGVVDRTPSPAGLALLAGLLWVVRPRRSRA